MRLWDCGDASEAPRLLGIVGHVHGPCTTVLACPLRPSLLLSATDQALAIHRVSEAGGGKSRLASWLSPARDGKSTVQWSPHGTMVLVTTATSDLFLYLVDVGGGRVCLPLCDVPC